MQEVSRRSFFSALGGAAALAALAACGGGGSGPVEGGSGGQPASGPWEFTDDLGRRISLPQRPQRIVAYVSGAAALWDFGVRPVGLYGPSKNADGTPNLLAGNIDLGTMQSVGGEDYSNISIERLLALKPDLLLASLNGSTADRRWVIKDDIAQIERVCPVYSVQESATPLPDVISSYETLAQRLGADVAAPDVTTARDAFTQAGNDLRAAIAEKPGLRTEFVYADTSGMYVASPKFYSTLIWYRRLGLTVARQDDPSDEFLQRLSWEDVGRYPADLICTDIRAFSLPQQQIIARFPTFAKLPAVRAGQLGGYNGEPRFSYQQAVTEVRELAASVRRSRAGLT